MKRNPSNMRETSFDDRADDAESPSRMFLHEPGWGIRIKTGSHREFCYTMAPGQDFYHRLLDGEVFLIRNDEKLCLTCAARRGLIVSEPKRLRDVIGWIPADAEAIPLDLDCRGAQPSRG